MCRFLKIHALNEHTCIIYCFPPKIKLIMRLLVLRRLICTRLTPTRLDRRTRRPRLKRDSIFLSWENCHSRRFSRRTQSHAPRSSARVHCERDVRTALQNKKDSRFSLKFHAFVSCNSSTSFREAKPCDSNLIFTAL